MARMLRFQVGEVDKRSPGSIFRTPSCAHEAKTHLAGLLPKLTRLETDQRPSLFHGQGTLGCYKDHWREGSELPAGRDGMAETIGVVARLRPGPGSHVRPRENAVVVSIPRGGDVVNNQVEECARGET